LPSEEVWLKGLETLGPLIPYLKRGRDMDECFRVRQRKVERITDRYNILKNLRTLFHMHTATHTQKIHAQKKQNLSHSYLKTPRNEELLPTANS
jgi:hypothetical protein